MFKYEKMSDDSLDINLESYKMFLNELKTLRTGEEEKSFSCDLNKFNDDCSKFIMYIRQCIENNEISILYMLRTKNTIHYGKYDQGIKYDKDVIEMISDEDLKKLYELMQNEFSSNFAPGCKHTFGEGWSLNPIIGENVMIEIDSSSPNDRNWFYEESHKKDENNLVKKK